MALSDSERAFMEAGRAAGYSDDELVAKVKERRGAGSPYRPTDYAGEAAKLPPVSLTPGEAAGIPQLRDDSGENAFTRFMHRAIPETRRYRDATTGQDAPAPGDPVAHDPTAQAVLAGVLGAGAGSLAGGVARPILSSAVNSATQTAVQGGDLEDVGKSAAIGAAIPLAGRVAGAVGRRIRGGEGGQARALWEKHGGNVGPLDSGSGVDEIAGMEPSRANVGRASQKGAENIREALSGDFEKNTAAPYRAAREAIDYGPAGKEMVDVSSLRGTIADELYAERTPQAVRPFLQRELDHLDKLRDADGRVMATQSRLNEMKQRLQDQADYGINTGAGTGSIKDRSFKTVANAAKVLVDEGPYTEANAGYSAGMARQAEDRAALGLRKRPAASEAGRAAEDAKVAQILRNRNNNAEAAGAMAERADIPGFVARHPELERQVDLPDLVRAKGKLQFGIDGSPTENLIEAARHRGVTGRALELARHNAAALAGRVAYRPAGAGIVADDILSSPELNKILAAYAAQKEQERRRAEALGR